MSEENQVWHRASMQAAQVAVERFDKYLERLNGDGLQERFQDQQGSLDDYSIEGLREQLTEEMDRLTEMVEHATDEKELVTETAHMVDELTDVLFFGHNDLHRAKLTYELLEQYVEALILEMNAHGQKDEQFTALMRRMVQAYGICITSYEMLRAEVFKQSEEQFVNLGDWAEATLRQEANNPRLTVSPSMREGQARKMFGELLRDEFGFQPPKKFTPAHPVTFYLGKRMEAIAVRRAQSVWSQLPPEQREVSDILDVVSNEFGKLLGHVTQVGESGGLNTLFALPVIQEYLRQSELMAHGLPIDFHDRLDRAMAHAEKASLKAVGRCHGEWNREIRLNCGTSRRSFEQAEWAFGSVSRLEMGMRSVHETMRKRMATVVSLEEVNTQLDRHASVSLNKVLFCMSEPAELTVMQTYMEAFTRALKAELKDERTAMQQAEVIQHAIRDKYAQAYENYTIVRDWCLEATEGSHDNFGTWAFMTLRAHAGNPMDVLQQWEFEEILPQAEHFYRDVCKEKGIPKDLSGAPFMPLLITRCTDWAEEEYRGKHADELKLYVSHVTPRQEANLVKTIQRKERHIEKEVGQRTLELLDGVVSMFPGGAPESGVRNPWIHAQGLSELTEIFEARCGRKTGHGLH